MPYLQVIRAKKLGGQFAGHTRQHARRVAESATAPFRDRLPPGREFLDLYEYQLAIGEELDRRHDELTAIDDRHARELELDRQLREQRDSWMAQVRDVLMQVKDTVEGHYGTGSARILFQEDPPRIPNDPVAAHQLAERLHGTLTDPGFSLESTQPGVVVNPRVLAKSIEGPMNGLGDTLRRLHDSESATRHTQSLKDAALEDTEVYDGKVARFYEAFFDLAGHGRLAKRLRRSSHVRSADNAPQAADPEAEADPPAEPVADDASASPAEGAADVEASTEEAS